MVMGFILVFTIKIKWSFDHNFDHNGGRIMENSTFVLSLIGTLAWLPTIFNWFIRSKIKGRLIGTYILEKSTYTRGSILSNATPPIEGTIYILRLSLVTTKKNFDVSDMKVKIKTKDCDYEKEAVLFFCPVLSEKDDKGVFKRFLKFNYEENILYYPTFMKNQRLIGDIMFISDGDVNTSNFEYFNIEIYSKKKKQSVKFYNNEVANAINIFDEDAK